MKLLDYLHRFEAYVPFILRIGLGLVFLWFGLDKFVHPKFWMNLVPEFIANLVPFSLSTFNLLQGIVETVVGLLLLIGLWHQFAAIIAGLILIPIVAVMGVQGIYDIALRDFGLLCIAVAIAVTPETIIGVDSWRIRRIEEKIKK